jgi:small subunit ribosomal protein S16
MLKIRLQRTGKRGQAYFRVVVLEHTKKPKGEVLELLGSYNPHEKEFKVDKEKVDIWMAKGAQISPTVNNLMVNYKIWDKPKMQSWKPKKKEEAPVAATSAAKTPEEPAKEEAPAEAPAETPTEPAPDAATS